MCDLVSKKIPYVENHVLGKNALKVKYSIFIFLRFDMKKNQYSGGFWGR